MLNINIELRKIVADQAEQHNKEQEKWNQKKEQMTTEIAR